MKLRYYLRGLGIGIVITAIFFLVSDNSSSQTMSDEMIKARARELGMVENTVLADLSVPEEMTTEEESTPVVETTEEETEEETTLEETTEEAVSEEEAAASAAEPSEAEPEPEPPAEEPSSQEAESQAVVPEAEPSESAEPSEPVSPNTEPVSIIVNRGEGSDTVSRRLYEAGLVPDANEYDRYLMTNGYDKRISTGEHSIPAGASWDEIARILCN